MQDVVGLPQVLVESAGGATTLYVYGVARLMQVQGDDAEWFLGDALGSVRQLVDEDGAVVLARGYDPFGSERRVGNSMEDLRLTALGWNLGQKIGRGELSKPQQVADWIREPRDSPQTLRVDASRASAMPTRSRGLGRHRAWPSVGRGVAHGGRRPPE